MTAFWRRSKAINVEDDFAKALQIAGTYLKRATYYTDAITQDTIAAIFATNATVISGEGVTAQEKAAFWNALASLFTAYRAVIARRKYYICTIVLAVLVVANSVATYVAIRVSKDATDSVINMCATQIQNCPPSILAFSDKDKADTLRSKFMHADEHVNNDDLNIINNNLYYQISWLRWFTHYPGEDKFYLLNQGEPRGAFIYMVATLVQQLIRVRVIYDAFSTYILPILYALLGASAYNLRNLAATTETNTVTKSSLVRADIRMWLALVAGAIIAFFEPGGVFQPLQSRTPNLPQQAIAFLAGYGVEILFSAFDGIVDVFKKMRPTP